MKKAEILLSLFVGLCVSAYPAYQAYLSQSEHHDLEKPAPEIYEADPHDFESVVEAEPQRTEKKAATIPDTPEINYLVDDGIPEEIKEAAEYYGEIYGICPELIEAIAEHESTFESDAVNDSEVEHSVGIMQINLKCKDHQKRLKEYGFTEADMTSLENSVIIACDYLTDLFETYEDVGEVLIRYNGDKSGYKEYKKSGKLSEYATEILARSEELEVLHGKNYAK